MNNNEEIKSNLFFVINALINAKNQMEKLEEYLMQHQLIDSNFCLYTNVVDSINTIEQLKSLFQNELKKRNE